MLLRILIICAFVPALFGMSTTADERPVTVNGDGSLQSSDSTEIVTKFYGNYELRNVFVYNSVLADSSRCITRAPEVNDEITNIPGNASTIEIKLDELNLHLGDPLVVVIYHNRGCKPVLVNPEVIDPNN